MTCRALTSSNREAARVEQLEQRNPVHAGGLHRYGVHAALAEPVGQALEVGGEAGELAHRLVVPVGRHGHEVRGAADVDAGSVGVGRCQGRLSTEGRDCVAPWLAPSSVVECGAASGTSSCSLSQTGYRPAGHRPERRFTNVDDVTHDHANPRAMCTIATSVFRGATFHLATTPPPLCFFGAICGSGPITSLTHLCQNPACSAHF